MNIFFSTVAQVWYIPLFAAFLLTVGILSQAGVIRSFVHRARPGLGWGVILGGAIFLIVLIVGATFVSHREATGESLTVLMYSVSFSIPVFAIAVMYLVFARKPPRFVIPAWIRREQGKQPKGKK